MVETRICGAWCRSAEGATSAGKAQCGQECVGYASGQIEPPPPPRRATMCASCHAPTHSRWPPRGPRQQQQAPSAPSRAPPLLCSPPLAGGLVHCRLRAALGPVRPHPAVCRIAPTHRSPRGRSLSAAAGAGRRRGTGSASPPPAAARSCGPPPPAARGGPRHARGSRTVVDQAWAPAHAARAPAEGDAANGGSRRRGGPLAPSWRRGAPLCLAPLPARRGRGPAAAWRR